MGLAKTDHDLSCESWSESVWEMVLLHSNRLVLERGDAQLHGCSYATLRCVGTWKLHNIMSFTALWELHTMRGDDPWLQYVYDLALRWELDHMIGNWWRPMHDNQKRSLRMRKEGQLPN